VERIKHFGNRPAGLGLRQPRIAAQIGKTARLRLLSPDALS
jgi:hypothetical protein